VDSRKRCPLHALALSAAGAPVPAARDAGSRHPIPVCPITSTPLPETLLPLARLPARPSSATLSSLPLPRLPEGPHMVESLDPRERGTLSVPSQPFVGFLRWLQRQSERPDVVGSFSRNVMRIEKVRRGHFSTLVTLLCFCQAMPDTAMQTALDLALAEWRREVLSGRSGQRTYNSAVSALPSMASRMRAGPGDGMDLIGRGRAPQRIGPGIAMPSPPQGRPVREAVPAWGESGVWAAVPQPKMAETIGRPRNTPKRPR